MFKQAYVRGVVNGAVHSGLAAFPAGTQEKVADFIASRLDIPLYDEKTGAALEVPAAVTVKVAEAVLEASNAYKQAGHQAAPAVKIASVEDLAQVAHAHVLDLMKQAEGSTIEGGDKGNHEPTTGEGKMDAAARPAGYAEDSRGKTEVDTKPGAVGKEEPSPNAPSNSPSGDNSATDQSRTASLANLIQKMAEGSTILGGDKGNEAPHSAEGKMDVAMRPAGYGMLPHQGAPGSLAALISGAAVVGKEMPHPNAPANHPAGTNSLLAHSQKAAAEDPFIALFKKVAEEVSPYLPEMGDDEKIAHIKTMMGFTTEQKAAHITGLQRSKSAAAVTAPTATAPVAGYAHYDGKTANQKVAEGLPAALAEHMFKAKDGEKSKDDDKKPEDKKPEDKKEDEKKEGSLLDRIRNIAAA